MSKLFLNNTPIKNIVFDFGGVLLDIDFSLTYRELSRLLGVEFFPEKISDEARQVLIDFEVGKTTKENFIWSLQRYSQKEVPHGFDIIKAWNYMLLGWQPNKLEFLMELKTKYNLFLLSNTNEIHIEWVHRDLVKNHSITHFEKTYFDKVYYSHMIGLRKPNKEIFQYVLQDAHISSEETLFIDDLLENVMSAVSMGFQAYHHNPNDDLISAMNEIFSI